MTETIEELSRSDAYAVFHCPTCDCLNVAWEGSEKYNAIIERGILEHSYTCSNGFCKCHTTGNRVQAKRYEAKEPNW